MTSAYNETPSHRTASVSQRCLGTAFGLFHFLQAHPKLAGIYIPYYKQLVWTDHEWHDILPAGGSEIVLVHTNLEINQVTKSWKTSYLRDDQDSLRLNDLPLD